MTPSVLTHPASPPKVSRFVWLGFASLALLAALHPGQARAGNLSVSVGLHAPGVSLVAYPSRQQVVVPPGYVLGANGVLYPQAGYAQPVYTQPVYSQHVYSQPVYSQPVYSQPVYVQPRSYYVQPAPVYAQRPAYPHFGHALGHVIGHGVHRSIHQGHGYRGHNGWYRDGHRGGNHGGHRGGHRNH
ncbi:MAG: hypothetical protein ACKVOO_11705 [Burkholderiaceae bacterium]